MVCQSQSPPWGSFLCAVTRTAVSIAAHNRPVWCVLALLISPQPRPSSSPRRSLCVDPGWRFFLFFMVFWFPAGLLNRVFRRSTNPQPAPCLSPPLYMRPFPGVDEHGSASLHQVQATGAFQRYRAVAAGGGGTEATARLASADPIDGAPSVGGRAATGADDVVEGEAGAVADGDGRRHGRHRRPLLPEHRAALKRAVSALWEPSSGGGGSGGGGGGGSDEGGRGRDDEEDRERERTRGGLTASELSAAVYGVQQRDASWHERGDPAGAGDSDLDPEEEGGQAWDHGVGCSREDFEEILLELEAEEKISN